MQKTPVDSYIEKDPPGEGIDYQLQYSWALLVAQLLKNSPTQETLGLIPRLGRSYLLISALTLFLTNFTSVIKQQIALGNWYSVSFYRTRQPYSLPVIKVRFPSSDSSSIMQLTVSVMMSLHLSREPETQKLLRTTVINKCDKVLCDPGVLKSSNSISMKPWQVNRQLTRKLKSQTS